MDEKIKNAELLYGQLEQLGINKGDIRPEDIDKMLQGKMSDLIEFRVNDSQRVREFLDKQNVDYRIENDKIKNKRQNEPFIRQNRNRLLL